MPPSSLPPRRRPSYDPGRDRARLRQMLWMGVVLVVLFQVARTPGTWTWLTELDRPRPKPTEPQAPSPRLPSRTPLPDGVVRIEPAADPAFPDAPPPSAPQGELPLTLEPELIATIEHDFHVLRASETPVLERMLAAVRGASLSKLERAARPEATFPELANDPERYAGRLYRFRAEVRRCLPFPTKTPTGEDRLLYEAWAFTESGGRKNPYRILCTDLPEGFPLGESIRARVDVTAYFFKQYAYVTAHGPHVAPLFIARRFRWTKPPVALSDEVGPTPLVALLIASIGTALAIAAWRITTPAPRRTSASTALANPSAPDLSALPQTAAPSVEEFLQTLAQAPPNPEQASKQS
jgi:hypothetical protein